MKKFFTLIIMIACCNVVIYAQSPKGKKQIDLPVIFQDSATVNCTLVDFGGNVSVLGADPMNAKNIVAISTKTPGAQTWAGTTMGTPDGLGFIHPVPFTATATKMSVLVYSPAAGIHIRLKIEDHTDATKSVETEALSKSVNAWDSLVFDFSNQAAGTAALNLAYTYDKASIFFDFNNAGTGSVYYWDNVRFIGGGAVTQKKQIDLPVIFQDTATVKLTFVDFGGNATVLGADPKNAKNVVAISTKTPGAQTWAGTTMGTPDGLGFLHPVPFTATNTKMTVLVYSPAAGIHVRLKVEDHTDGTKSVETEALSKSVNAWDSLVFDFSNQAAGTAALNLAYTYDKASIFFDFGNAGTGSVFYWDNVRFIGGGVLPKKTQIDLPVTFQDTATVNCTLVDFGGNASVLGADPINANNIVAITTKTPGAQTWAGTTMGTPDGLGFLHPVPFSATATKMSVLVYSPAAGIHVRLKVEDHTDGTKSVETEALSKSVNAWDSLVFDFSNQAAGTAALNLAYTYDKASIFFDFGNAGTGSVYYWDNVKFIGGGVVHQKAQIDLPVTFQDTATVNCTLVDFGGNASVLGADPLNANNIVAITTKTPGAQTWAGTTIGTPDGLGFLHPVPFDATHTKMSALVYSPAAGIHIRLKVEDHTDATKSVETEALSKSVNKWDSLVFDFSNQAAGTAAINLGYTYDKASIFFDFGNAGTGSVYYWDNVRFISGNQGVKNLDSPSAIKLYPNPVQSVLFVENLSGNNLVKIFNMSGRLLINSKIINNKIDVSDFVPGVYAIQIIYKDNVSYLKFIKE